MAKQRTGGDMNSSKEILEDLLAEREVERLRLFGKDIAVDVHYFFDHTVSTRDGNAVEGSVGQVARLHALMKEL